MRLSAILVSTLLLTLTLTLPATMFAFSASQPKVLVLGIGFLGSEIVLQLKKLGIAHVTASRSAAGPDRSCDHTVDLLAPDAAEQIQKIARGCDAVISTVGAIGTKQDIEINAASGQAAIGAKRAGVKRFVFIGNEPRVRKLCSSFGPLKDYAAGKEQAEAVIREQFPNQYTIVQPNFMYGGQVFSLSPPRIPGGLGQVVEDILNLYPFQAASNALPGILGIILGAPVSRERVATAAINAALGVCTKMELASRDDIIRAAAKRWKPVETKEKDVRVLKKEIYDLGDCGGDPEKLKRAFDLLGQIESLRTRKPAQDRTLNGRWEFVFDVEADLGTGVVKDILEGRSPIKPIFDLKDLCLKIFDDDNTGEKKVNVYVSTKLLSAVPVELIIKTNIIPDESDPTGTMFSERFEGMRFAGVPLPIPEDWRRGRPLEFSYLDDTMLIARGNGGEPHYLKREKDNCDVELENCYL